MSDYCKRWSRVPENEHFINTNKNKDILLKMFADAKADGETKLCFGARAFERIQYPDETVRLVDVMEEIQTETGTVEVSFCCWNVYVRIK
jgi:hypothetical protein